MKRKLQGNVSLTPLSLSHHSSLSYDGTNKYNEDHHQELFRPEHKPFSVHEHVEPKPDMVKRCRKYNRSIEISDVTFTINFSLLFSFVPVHNCVLQKRSLPLNHDGDQRDVLLQQRVRQAGRHLLRLLRQRLRSVLSL